MQRLTRRQKEFLEKLVSLHRALAEPIHYSALAEHLGVGKIAAYEMLRLLEKHGYVSAEYQRPVEAHGPGRPTVVFRPTPSAVELFDEEDQQTHGLAEWERVKIIILEKLRRAKAEGNEGVLDEMISLLASHSSPIEYLTGMVAAIIIGVQSLKSSLGSNTVRKAFKSIDLPGERGLRALGGLSIGLSLVEKWNQRVSQAFLDHVHRYQTMLSDLNEENRKRLSQFTSDVIKIVSS
jgi:DNA-binding PadR family transcriptional regulator